MYKIIKIYETIEENDIINIGRKQNSHNSRKKERIKGSIFLKRCKVYNFRETRLTSEEYREKKKSKQQSYL